MRKPFLFVFFSKKEEGDVMNCFIRTCLCMALCFSFCVSANQLYGQEVVYSVSGVFEEDAFGQLGFGQEFAGESYVAEFVIDTSAPDIDDDPDRGEFPNAILSATVVFESGFVSEVDFSGGIVTVLRDADGGGIFLQDAGQDSSFVVFQLGIPFDSDALLTDPAIQFSAAPDSLVLLAEPSVSGSLISFSNVDLNAPGGGSGAIVFAIVSGADDSVLLGDCDLDGAVTFADIPVMIDVLVDGSFLDQADCNADGTVGFEDIPSFIDILMNSSGTASSSGSST